MILNGAKLEAVIATLGVGTTEIFGWLKLDALANGLPAAKV